MKLLQKLSRLIKVENRLFHTMDFKGVYPPITTPFDDQLNLSIDKLDRNMDKWNEVAFRGYVIFGSNGEYKSLDESEKVEIMKFVKKKAGRDKLLIAGTGCESSAETIKLSNKMADLGADAVLVINPSYYKNLMNSRALDVYYRKVADGCKIPVIIYNMPLFTGIDMDAQLIVQLSQHNNIVGVKESTANIMKISEMISLSRREFNVFAGSADFLLPSLLMGAAGGICASANVIGDDVVRMYNLFGEGKLRESIDLQKKLLLPNKAVTRMFSVAGLKQAMDWVGYYGGPCRPPLLPLDEEQKTILKDIFVRQKYI